MACGNKGYLKVIIQGCKTWMSMVLAMFSELENYGSPTTVCVYFISSWL